MGIESMEFSRPEHWKPCSSPGDLPARRIKPRSPALQEDSLAETQGKAKNTGVGSLSLLQQIVPTQEPNWSPLHLRWILYQLSYQGTLPLQINKYYIYICIYIFRHAKLLKCPTL